MGQAGADGRPGHEDRDPPGHRASTSSRRTTSGSRRSGRGGRPPASCEPDRVRRTSREAVEAVWRIESARIVGALARYTGDFALAEDLAQEALAEALVTWPRDGVPAQPGGVAAHGRAAAGDRRVPPPRRPSTSGTPPSPATWARAAPSRAPRPPIRTTDDVLWDPDRIDDDVLALMFIACHPVLSREARVALTLRVVGGLTSDEIARAFLVPTATVQARITRAKKTLAAAQVPFEVPPPDERRERLGSVLSVVYVIFTEGSTATSGDRLDPASTSRARRVRLARVLARLVPDEPEVHGLLALLELTAARFPARTGPGRRAGAARGPGPAAVGPGGDPARAGGAGQAGRVGRGLGAYGLQAAIAECHAVAPSVDGDRLGAHRAALRGARPAGAVAGGRAQPGGRGVDGPGPGGGAADRRRAGRAPARSPARTCCPSVRGELLTRLGRADEARAELDARRRAVRQRARAGAARAQARGPGLTVRPLRPTGSGSPGAPARGWRTASAARRSRRAHSSR